MSLTEVEKTTFQVDRQVDIPYQCYQCSSKKFKEFEINLLLCIKLFRLFWIENLMYSGKKISN